MPGTSPASTLLCRTAPISLPRAITRRGAAIAGISAPTAVAAVRSSASRRLNRAVINIRSALQRAMHKPNHMSGKSRSQQATRRGRPGDRDQTGGSATMPSYIALLRAVNVGGTGKLPMSELKAMCVAEGFAKVQTYIASGNVVLESRLSAARVKAVLEQRLHAYAGKPVGVIIRT